MPRKKEMVYRSYGKCGKVVYTVDTCGKTEEEAVRAAKRVFENNDIAYSSTSELCSTSRYIAGILGYVIPIMED